MTDDLWYSSGCGRIAFQLSADCVADICQSGNNGPQVFFWRQQDDVAAILGAVPPDLLASELRGYGAWDDDELSDHEKNLDRLLWLAAWQIHEERMNND
jgi:hypothetical protein